MTPDNTFDTLMGKVEVMVDAAMFNSQGVPESEVSALLNEIETAYNDGKIYMQGYGTLLQLMEDAGLAKCYSNNPLYRPPETSI